MRETQHRNIAKALCAIRPNVGIIACEISLSFKRFISSQAIDQYYDILHLFSDHHDTDIDLDRYIKADSNVPSRFGKGTEARKKIPTFEQCSSILKLYINNFECDDNKL